MLDLIDLGYGTLLPISPRVQITPMRLWLLGLEIPRVSQVSYELRSSE
jgi:hypothetical protein